MPIQNRDDAVEVETQIASIFAASPDGRTNAIRCLFVETLDFNGASGQVSLTGASANVVLPEAAERVAVLDGVSVVYVPLNIEGTDRVRKAEVDAAARLIGDQLGDEMLLVFTNTSASQLHLILPKFEGARPTLQRMVVERDLPRRTAVQQVAGIYWNHRDKGLIRAVLNEAFDVEPVTKDFFAEYKRIFENAMGTVTGFGEEETENKRTFVQTLFNRLMFVYFLSRKGWLRFGNNADYLNALWQDYGNGLGDDNLPPRPAPSAVLLRPEQPQLPGPDRGAADCHRRCALPQRRVVRGNPARQAQRHHRARRGHPAGVDWPAHSSCLEAAPARLLSQRLTIVYTPSCMPTFETGCLV